MGPDEPIERWTAKRRAALVLRVLKGETSVVEAARQHILPPLKGRPPLRHNPFLKEGIYGTGRTN